MPPGPPTLFNDPPPAPHADWVTAHCDGGARGNPGPAGFGAVLHSAAGEKLAELSEFLGVCSNNVAEYSGLLGVLAWSLTHNVKRLRVISDSDLMVKQIQGKYAVKSPDLRPLWEEARRRIARLDAFEISHALRHKNKDADRLANEAMDRGMGRTPAAPRATPAVTQRAAQAAVLPQTPQRATPHPPAGRPQMLRGFTRDGRIELLGPTRLPDGIFVKVIVE